MLLQGLRYFFFFQLSWFVIIFCSNCTVITVLLCFQTNYFPQPIYFTLHPILKYHFSLSFFLKNLIYQICHKLTKTLFSLEIFEISCFWYYYLLQFFSSSSVNESFLNQTLARKHDWFRKGHAKNVFSFIFGKSIEKFILMDHGWFLLSKTIFLTYFYLN